jgi:hypothetical protein
MSSGGASESNNARQETEFSARKSSPDLMRHVLDATLARGSNAMTSEEWERLQALARKHATDDLDMSQVAEILVTSLLGTRFPDLTSANEKCLMCQRIAGSLCGDPASMQRLKTFWNQLRESVA